MAAGEAGRGRHGARDREAVEPCRGLAAGRHDHVAQAERGARRDLHARDRHRRGAHGEAVDGDPVAEVATLVGPNVVSAPVSFTSTVAPRAPRCSGSTDTRRGTAGVAGATSSGPTPALARRRSARVTARKPIAAPAPTVTFATADVGELAVRWLTVTPAPRSRRCPRRSASARPRSSRHASSRRPRPAARPTRPRAPPAPRPPAARRSPPPRPRRRWSRSRRGSRGGARRHVSRTVMRVGDSTCVAPTDTPVPPTATVLPASGSSCRSLRARRRASVPRGSAAGVGRRDRRRRPPRSRGWRARSSSARQRVGACTPTSPRAGSSNRPPENRVSSLNVRNGVLGAEQVRRLVPRRARAGRVTGGGPAQGAARGAARRVLPGRAAAGEQRVQAQALRRVERIDARPAGTRPVAVGVGGQDRRDCRGRAAARRSSAPRFDPSGQSGVDVRGQPGDHLLSRSGSRLTRLDRPSCRRTSRSSPAGRRPGRPRVSSIIVSSPVLIAPISGPMLPVTSIDQRERGAVDLEVGGLRAARADRDALALVGSVSAAQSTPRPALRNSCVKSASTRVYIEQVGPGSWRRRRAARPRRRSRPAGRRGSCSCRPCSPSKPVTCVSWIDGSAALTARTLAPSTGSPLPAAGHRAGDRPVRASRRGLRVQVRRARPRRRPRATGGRSSAIENGCIVGTSLSSSGDSAPSLPTAKPTVECARPSVWPSSWISVAWRSKSVRDCR